MTVKAGRETIRIADILVGDVWLCSGQSNMEMSVSQSADGKAEIKAANHPNIRLFNVPRPIDPIAIDPQDDIVGQWQACSPDTIPNFSAVGYSTSDAKSINVPPSRLALSIPPMAARSLKPGRARRKSPACPT
jgi:sialate O-acetylesterase